MATESPPTPVLYADRENWRDVAPLEQSDLENPLVPIFYPIECKYITVIPAIRTIKTFKKIRMLWTTFEGSSPSRSIPTGCSS